MIGKKEQKILDQVKKRRLKKRKEWIKITEVKEKSYVEEIRLEQEELRKTLEEHEGYPKKAWKITIGRQGPAKKFEKIKNNYRKKFDTTVTLRKKKRTKKTTSTKKVMLMALNCNLEQHQFF